MNRSGSTSLGLQLNQFHLLSKQIFHPLGSHFIDIFGHR